MCAEGKGAGTIVWANHYHGWPIWYLFSIAMVINLHYSIQSERIYLMEIYLMVTLLH